MKDDDESVKLREEHTKWMELHGLAQETLDMAETVGPRWLGRFIRFLLRQVIKGEQAARKAARKTY